MARKVQRDLEAMQQANIASQTLMTQARSEMDGNKMDDCLVELESTGDAIRRMRDTLNALLSSDVLVASAPAQATWKASEMDRVQAQLANVTRKCELLVALERDGRLENTELHKAFNEELDRMYDDAQLSQEEQVVKLRAEVRHAKSQRNEAYVERK